MMYQPASPANQTIAAAVCVIMISKVPDFLTCTFMMSVFQTRRNIDDSCSLVENWSR